MSADEFKAIMTKHNMCNNDIMLIADVSFRQVTSWRNGAHGIPRAVSMVLQAYDKGKIDLPWIERVIRKEMRDYL
jgi:hypothetical protein